MYAAIGRRIREFRKAKRITQEELAERAGISLSFLGHIERGTRKASVETIYHLMIALDCTANDILGTPSDQEEGSRISAKLFDIAYKLQDQGM